MFATRQVNKLIGTSSFLAQKIQRFFFQRAFQDYHADRFPDNSLMFWSDGRLIAVLPASRAGDEVVSHGGLTFGGVISDAYMTTSKMLEIFDALLENLRSRNIKRFVYKSIPSFYHKLPADEDSYALFRSGARLFRRDVGSVLRPCEHPPIQKRRLRSLKKALKAGLEFAESQDYEEYWHVLEETLAQRHNVQPVHSIGEISMLHSKFSSNIRLFTAKKENKILAGTVIFESATVAHAQYIAASAVGREVGALDFIFSELIANVFSKKRWFSFGISTEQQGQVLNEGPY